MKIRLDPPFRQAWHLYAIILILLCVMFSLLLDLRISRNNEREMSRRVYEAVRQSAKP